MLARLSSVSLSKHSGGHHNILFRDTSKTSCLNCFLSVLFAAYEVGGTPEQPASQHVWWYYIESNVVAHGAGHLQQTHQKFHLWPSLLLYQKTGPVGAGQPFPGSQFLFLLLSGSDITFLCFFLYFNFGYSPESPQAFILKLVSALSIGLLKYTTNNADRIWCQDGWLRRNDPLTSVPCFVFLSLSLSFSQLDGLLTDRESLPERSKEIRERLRGKGLPSGKMSGTDTHIKHRAIRAEFACCVVKGTFERCRKCCLFRQWFQFLACQQFMIKGPGSY